MEKNEILVIYGNTPAEMAVKIAEAADLAQLIGERKKRIGLKPNLVVSRPASEGATTHPEIAAGLVSYLKKNGFDNIAILEGAWVGDSTTKAFSACGYSGFAKEMDVELIDTQKDSYETIDCNGIKIDICKSALSVDFMINLPVLKGHCQTLLTCALKNHKGVITDKEKRRFHTIGLHKPIAHLNTKVPSDFILVDGICGDLDFEEGGNPLFGGRMFAARDPVLCDTFAAELIGYDASEIPYIGFAEKLGVGISGPAQVRELNKNSEAQGGGRAAKSSGKVKQLSGFIREEGSCSACYAGLVYALSRLDRNDRSRLQEVCIGQGFKGKKGKTGVGLCTAAFDAYCPGCPPSGAQVLQFLQKAVR
jgi:uncharacterized protein (DUF362 family)